VRILNPRGASFSCLSMGTKVACRSKRVSRSNRPQLKRNCLRQRYANRDESRVLTIYARYNIPSGYHYTPSPTTHSPQSRLGPSATKLNLNSPPPASSSLFKKLFTPRLNAFSLNTSSSFPNSPRSNGPFLLPSSSQRWLFADLTKQT